MDAFYQQLLRFRLLVVLAAIVLVVAGRCRRPKLVFKSDYRVFFGQENPQLQNFERMQKTFAKSDNALFILAPKDGNVFSQQALAAMAWLTEQSWQLPYSTGSIRSPTSSIPMPKRTT